jgi:FlaG/FlaF family flagellin (archaellin)
MNKRAISAIVATVLIILITVAAVTIVWSVVIPMVRDNLEFSELEGRVDILTSGGYTFYDPVTKIASVQIKRDQINSSIVKMHVVFDFDDGSSFGNVVVAPEVGQIKSYDFNLADRGEPSSVSVAPIFLIGKKEKEGEFISGSELVDGEYNFTIESFDKIKDNVSFSCLDILNSGGSVGDGVYEIDPDGEGGREPFEVYCDMGNAGGGWTMIASYYNGAFFNNCSEFMEYGVSCSSHCGEFNIVGDAHCNNDEEREIQLAEMERLRRKFIINESYSNVSNYGSSDVVLPSYYLSNFSEMMFLNPEGEFLTYDLSGEVGYSMRNFYDSIKDEIQLEVRFPVDQTNLDASVNDCGTLEIAMNSADNDGGGVNYLARMHNSWSSAGAGPTWDSANNGGCHYDDRTAEWNGKRLGGENNGQSQYIMWLVR